MKRRLDGWLAALAAILTAALGLAQDFQPPPGQTPDAATRKQIAAKLAAVQDAIKVVRDKGLPDELLADFDVFPAAAEAILRHNEFFQPEYAAWTLAVLERGRQRAVGTAAALAKDPGEKGNAFDWLRDTGKTAIRGYRSRIDGSVQPYAVTLPAGYGEDPKTKYRVDVVLHGRDAKLTEVKFLYQHDGKAAKDARGIRIDIFGRGNNAYRWAGEMDILEAIENFITVEVLAKRDQHIDTRRWVLRGFSMGGAGAWHLGLHRPDVWCVVGPGAGFSETHGYIKNLPKQLPDYLERGLRIYDAVDYAENVANVPVVAYGGSDDPQLQAARNIEARLKGTEFAKRLQILVAPGLKHQFPAEWQKKAEDAYSVFASKGREQYPKRVRFVTYTLKYPNCDWVRLLALVKHYDKAVVDASKTEEGFSVTTQNVEALRLATPPNVLHDMTVKIDGEEVTARPWGQPGKTVAVYLKRDNGKWRSVLPERLLTERAQKPRKVNNLQGPIDDAFMEAFLCVRGTGKGWHEATERYADADLSRFKAEWSKYFRGELLIKDDTDVTAADIADKHLILFGDPASNSFIAQVLDGLPLQWTKDRITFAGKTVPAKAHVPVLIHPNPLNATRYVVLNSGHTFHKADFEGTNALLYPRLGDFAPLRLANAANPLATEVVTAGLFDEYWQFPK